MRAATDITVVFTIGPDHRRRGYGWYIDPDHNVILTANDCDYSEFMNVIDERQDEASRLGWDREEYLLRRGVCLRTTLLPMGYPSGSVEGRRLYP